MEDLYLIKIGEISLKKGNKKIFEKQLKDNIKNGLRDYKTTVIIRSGRFYLTIHDSEESVVHDVLSKTQGIVSFFKAHMCEKNMDSIKEVAFNLVRQNLENNKGKTFKVETRRTDKSLKMDSYEFSAELGGLILDEFKDILSVNVKNPDFVINLELREHAYIYGFGGRGPGGLPVGSAGRGMLLLSGGIDSPVAGVMMAKRGVKLDAIYFHTPPYTSEESFNKVVDLTKIISPWCSGLNLFTVPFTKIQLKINQEVPAPYATLMGRACMMRIANIIGKRRKALCLVTGEAVGQVASQTIQSLHFTGSNSELPVFRPLVGMDKDEIIKISRNIKTYETSIQPFDDCCAMFAPPHPETRPDFVKTTEIFNSLNIEEMLIEAAEEAEYHKL
ncbi:tRNA 4-thiouridine(8) synthase ThiI [Thiospirochaeta perfilievii]|uniref:Probable tRNA sulfurtransferase n=1 Tax=Thiospirochaeta perfilievii TaxID=252967 RepID=A0A5C1QA03_9SPIO|nr:tRNA uracil 4-sulfurtransferase ThiI [Thiospirochaeta perfilievii]QEN03626.1 tRNA 4-thiouridine(8) synthase ThiI [Thiospirochaeta perfilievii]